jgi:hypothetical protein
MQFCGVLALDDEGSAIPRMKIFPPATRSPRPATGFRRADEYSFNPQMRETGRLDQRGGYRTTLALKWANAAFTPKDKKPKEWPKSLKLFHEVVVAALFDGGIEMRPWSDGPKIKAVDYEALRQGFYERLVTGGDAEAKQDSRKKGDPARRKGRHRRRIGWHQRNQRHPIRLACPDRRTPDIVPSTADNGT